MATTFICGFGSASPSEIGSASGLTISNRSTSAPFGQNPYYIARVAPSVACFGSPNIRFSGGTQKNFAQSFRFYLIVDNAPSADRIIFRTGNTAASTILTLVGTGSTVQFKISDGIAAASATSPGNDFGLSGVAHRIDVDVNGTTRKLYADGVLIATSSGGGSASPQPTPTFGNNNQADASMDISFAEIVIDDGSIGAPTSDQHIIKFLIPTAGNNAGSWTDGAGGTGDIHGSVANIPPVGVAAATAAAKIKNAASGTALDYVATMQSYSAAGIPPFSKINAIMAVCNDAEEIATGTKGGGVWCSANPAQSAVTVGAGVGFDYGDDLAAIEGTYPTGWTWHVGVVSVNPAVTLTTAPTVTVRKGSSTTRVVGVDAMGLYVDYTPYLIPTSVILRQAINRSQSY